MPTFEFFGYPSSTINTLISSIKEELSPLPYKNDIVFVKKNFEQEAVTAWDGSNRPFIRISSRSQAKVEQMRTLLNHLSDIETSIIGFSEQQTTTKPSLDAVSPDNLPATVDESFEQRLITHLDPIRQHVLSVSLYHLFDSGLYKELDQHPICNMTELSEKLDLNHHKVCGVMDYLQNEKIVCVNGDNVSLTETGKGYAEFEPWYTMLIGGYAETFMQVGPCLKNNAESATRDAAKVGLGSCGISYFDAIPLTQSLMQHIPTACRKLLDLGCGNGRYLAEFCQLFPEIEAWGVEPSSGGCDEAISLITEQGLEDRIKITCATATDFLRSDLGNYKPDLLVLGFILHEILGQDGEEATETFLKSVFTKFPEIHVIIIEVDDKISDSEVMSHGLAKAYYNPYYLLHTVTAQQLEGPSFWEALFKRCGLEVVSKKTTSPLVDSTGLEIGYLLKKKN